MKQTAIAKKSSILLFLVGIATFSLTGCHTKKDGNADTIMPKSTEPASVTVVPARVAPISKVINVTGTLTSRNDVMLGVKSAGKIAAVYVREGDFVRVGQVVAEMDTADARAIVDQQHANLLAAEARLAQAKVGLKNAKTTLQWTRDQTDSAIRLAQAGVRMASESSALLKAGARDQERKQAEEALAASRSERSRAESDMKRTETERTRARTDLKRYQDLLRQDAISQQLLDQAQAIADSADAAHNSALAIYNTADARFKSAQQTLSLVVEGARKEDIRKSEAGVDQAQQQLVSARSNRDQLKLRQADIENARVSIRAAEAGVRQAQAAHRLAKQAVQDARIVSTLNGVVAERRVEPGMQVAAGAAAVRVVGLDGIQFDAQLPETQIGDVQVGMPVVVRVDAVSRVPFNSKIVKIFPVASALARSFTVRISLPNPEKKLHPNQFARGEIIADTHPNAILVPRETVLNQIGTTGRVFVAVGDKAEERKVTLGFATLEHFEIATGVKAQEKVISIGQMQLQNGDAIKYVEPNKGL